ncbi:MAG: NADPH-dependent F420 reductase [Kineosporiaceae bacterium]
MKVAVLGTGSVGRVLAGKLSALGHDVVVGTRDPQATAGRSGADGYGNPPWRDWAAGHPGVRLAGYAAAASGADLVVNATAGGVSVAALRAAGLAAMPGVVVLDIANPLDHSAGFPPTLFVTGTDSLGERIQAAFPQARVVKSLNTMAADLMVDPGGLREGDHTVFVSGDDDAAKAQVTALLRSFGHTDVVDLGDITTARGTEALLPAWLRLFTALGTPHFQFKVVR